MGTKGIVTNVVNFGVSVDVGVHQDAPVHIPQLADRSVDDPKQVVKVDRLLKCGRWKSTRNWKDPACR